MSAVLFNFMKWASSIGTLNFKKPKTNALKTQQGVIKMNISNKTALLRCHWRHQKKANLKMVINDMLLRAHHRYLQLLADDGRMEENTRSGVCKKRGVESDRKREEGRGDSWGMPLCLCHGFHLSVMWGMSSSWWPATVRTTPAPSLLHYSNQLCM